MQCLFFYTRYCPDNVTVRADVSRPSPRLHVHPQEPISKDVCPWYDGKPLIQTLDELVIGGRNPDAPLRIPVLDKFVDRGTVLLRLITPRFHRCRCRCCHLLSIAIHALFSSRFPLLTPPDRYG
jgi:hypothetical protein